MDHGSSKKRKRRRTNETTSVSEEARAIAIVSSGEKNESREEKGSVKIWELESDNSDVERDSSDESDTNETSDWNITLHFCSAANSFDCFLLQATLAFVSFFVFPVSPDQLQGNPNYGKIISPP